MAAVGSAALLAFSPAAFSQQPGLVNVEISNAADDIARDLSVDVSQIPDTVQVLADVAAHVFGIDVGVLSQSGGGGAAGGCQAKSTSAALNQIVQGQRRSK